VRRSKYLLALLPTLVLAQLPYASLFPLILIRRIASRATRSLSGDLPAAESSTRNINRRPPPPPTQRLSLLSRLEDPRRHLLSVSTSNASLPTSPATPSSPAQPLTYWSEEELQAAIDAAANAGTVVAGFAVFSAQVRPLAIASNLAHIFFPSEAHRFVVPSLFFPFFLSFLCYPSSTLCEPSRPTKAGSNGSGERAVGKPPSLPLPLPPLPPRFLQPNIGAHPHPFASTTPTSSNRPLLDHPALSLHLIFSTVPPLFLLPVVTPSRINAHTPPTPIANLIRRGFSALLPVAGRCSSSRMV
jgi:hypothetical protein